jgi:CBS domain-containing protein
MGATLRTCSLVDASVPVSATFLDAARTLATAQVSAVAIVDNDRRVVGLVTEDDVVRGLFPGYVADLRHTAFLDVDAETLATRIAARGGEPVEQHMRRRPETLAIDTSALHVAERFLHCEWGALPVVGDDGRFVGMVRQSDFCRVILAGLPAA